MKYIFKMVKRMLRSKGATLIEMLLCISIISMLSIFTLQSYSQKETTLDAVINGIVTIIEDAKYYATSTSQVTEIYFTNSSISYQGTQEYTYSWDDATQLMEYNDFYFNSVGHVSNASAIEVCQNNTCKSIVIHLETGHVNVYEG